MFQTGPTNHALGQGRQTATEYEVCVDWIEPVWPHTARAPRPRRISPSACQAVGQGGRRRRRTVPCPAGRGSKSGDRRRRAGVSRGWARTTAAETGPKVKVLADARKLLHATTLFPAAPRMVLCLCDEEAEWRFTTARTRAAEAPCVASTSRSRSWTTRAGQCHGPRGPASSDLLEPTHPQATAWGRVVLRVRGLSGARMVCAGQRTVLGTVTISDRRLVVVVVLG